MDSWLLSAGLICPSEAGFQYRELPMVISGDLLGQLHGGDDTCTS